MLINIVNNLRQKTPPEKLYNFNMVVAWNLCKSFEKRGVSSHFVRDHDVSKKPPQTADHTLVISANAIRAMKKDRAYYDRLRASARGKLMLYLDSDFGKWGSFFDHVFTVVKPKRNKAYFSYGGWGADPEFFYPEQQERAVFVDSLKIPYHNGKFDDVFDTLKEVLKIPKRNLETGEPITQTIPNLNMTMYMPVPGYNKRFKVIYWPEIQGILRKCHYYCCTQWGESGLTRIEAATSGALLVVHEKLYRPRTMDSLEHRLWRTRDELIDVLMTKTDSKAIRKKALEHSWDKVVDRMLMVIEGKSG